MAIVKEYLDDRGVQRRVLVDKPNTRPSEGVPIDVFDILEDTFKDSPLSFRQKLYQGLWDRNLIEKKDFQKSTAPKDFRSALLAAIARDAETAINDILKE